MLAVWSEEVTEYLIGVGANVNHRDMDEYSALMLVVIYNLNISIFKLLLDADARPYVCDIYGNSLLSLMSSDRCTYPLVYLEELFSHGVFLDYDTHGQLQYGGCSLYLKNTSPIVRECFSTAKDSRSFQRHRLSLKYQALLNYLPPEPFREHFAEILEEKAECGLRFDHPPHGTHPDVVNSKGLDPIHSTDNVDIKKIIVTALSSSSLVPRISLTYMIVQKCSILQ